MGVGGIDGMGYHQMTWGAVGSAPKVGGGGGWPVASLLQREGTTMTLRFQLDKNSVEEQKYEPSLSPSSSSSSSASSQEKKKAIGNGGTGEKNKIAKQTAKQQQRQQQQQHKKQQQSGDENGLVSGAMLANQKLVQFGAPKRSPPSCREVYTYVQEGNSLSNAVSSAISSVLSGAGQGLRAVRAPFSRLQSSDSGKELQGQRQQEQQQRDGSGEPASSDTTSSSSSSRGSRSSVSSRSLASSGGSSRSSKHRLEYSRTGPCPAWTPCGAAGNMCTLELSGRRYASRSTAAHALLWLTPRECFEDSDHDHGDNRKMPNKAH